MKIIERQIERGSEEQWIFKNEWRKALLTGCNDERKVQMKIHILEIFVFAHKRSY